MKGQVVAASPYDFWNTATTRLNYQLAYAENATYLGNGANTQVWTGSDSSGMRTYSTCSDWTDSHSGQIGYYGSSEYRTSTLMQDSTQS